MPTLAYYLDTFNPIVLHLWGPISIRWYGLSYLAGFVLAYFIIRHVVRMGRTTLKVEEIADMVIAVALGAVLGGRLGYCLFYDPSLLGFVPHFPWWGVLAVTQGGMASHGGMIGALIGAWIYSRRRGHALGHVMDVVAFGTPTGLFLGRLANFVNGELYGRPCPRNFPLAMQFPNEMLHWPMIKWDQFQALTGNAAAGLDAQQIINRIIHGDSVLQAAARQVLTPRYPSQLFEAVAEGIVLFIVLAIVWWKPRKPWVLGSWFLMAYAILRITCEFFREPDFQIKSDEYAHWGITRGQVLSVGIFIAGLIVLVWARRRNVPRLGGWRKHPLPPAQ